MRVEILMYEGVSEADTLLPYSVFAKAALAGADVTVAPVTIDGTPDLTMTYGIQLAGLRTWRPADTDVLVVSGGWIEPLLDDGVIPGHLRAAKQANPDLILASACSGSLLLGRAGLLTGRPATTYRADHALLAPWAGEVVDARIVDDGDIVTAGSGWLSGLDLALYLLERELGDPRLPVTLEQSIGHNRRGTVWRRPPRNTGAVTASRA